MAGSLQAAAFGLLAFSALVGRVNGQSPGRVTYPAGCASTATALKPYLTTTEQVASARAQVMRSWGGPCAL